MYIYIYIYIYIYMYVFWKTKHVYNKNHWFWFKITVPIFLGLLTIMLMVNMIRISCKVQPLTQHRKSRMPLMKAWWNVLDLWGEHVRTPCSTKGTINYMCIIYIYNNIYIYICMHIYIYIYIHGKFNNKPFAFGVYYWEYLNFNNSTFLQTFTHIWAPKINKST